MNIAELLGAMVQTGMSPSSSDRMRNSLGGGSVLDSLAGMLGGTSQKDDAGGIGEALSGMLGGARGGSGGGISEVLSGMLGEAGRAVGGNKNLALGGLGALVGSLLGGGGHSRGGALGGGLMALLGTMAFNALVGGGQKPQVPLGLLEPETEAQKKELEQNSELILRAMINAIKADGEVDQDEINRITGKLKGIGVDPEAQRYLMTLIQQPMETERLIAAARGQSELAAQIYGASLLAIEVDTPAERKYLDRLAAGLNLSPRVTGRIQEQVGLQQA
jgi:uncharacterized membrane protein YebE (DUF533 family)